jgi:hypothetical protein
MEFGFRLPPIFSDMDTTSALCREILGHEDVLSTMIYARVLNRGKVGVRNPGYTLLVLMAKDLMR